nr:histone-lysine N-methyltransferase SETMAR-like [Penaeus vannamei]
MECPPTSQRPCSHIAQMAGWSSVYDILPHPTYFPDFAPFDLHLFPSMKSFFEGQKLTADFYKRGVDSCIKRWEKCVTLRGTYVEKD